MTPDDYETDLALLCSALRRLMADAGCDVVAYTAGEIGLHIELLGPGVVRISFQAGRTSQQVDVDFLSSTLWLDRDPSGSLLRTDLSAGLSTASGAALCELVHQHVRRLVHVSTMTAVRRGLRRGSGERPMVRLPLGKVTLR